MNAYPISPQSGGGHRRIKELYAALQEMFEIDVCTMGGDEFSGGYSCLSTELFETVVPRTNLQHQEALRIIKLLGVDGSHPDTDRTVRMNPGYAQMLVSRLLNAQLAIVCHPYLYPFLRSLWNGPIVYHSHDVEAEIQKDLLPNNATGRALYAAAVDIERACVRESKLTITMSREDSAAYVALYGADPQRMLDVPPSFDFDGAVLPSADARVDAKTALMPTLGPLAVFMGSNWGPNVAAARLIVDAARGLPNVTFAILGNVANGTGEIQIPPNVTFTGFVSEDTKRRILIAADVALNPTIASSGVNMKMGEYMLYGAPIITTPDGARGLALRHGQHAWVVQRERFGETISAALAKPRESRRRAENAFDHAREHFDERTNSQVLYKRLADVAGKYANRCTTGALELVNV